MNAIAQFFLTAMILLGVGALMWYKKSSGGGDGGDTAPTNPRMARADKARGKKGASTTPTLDIYARDLSRQAQLGRLDPVIGRHNEIMRVIQILSRRRKNNPLLLGEPGVGKTAIAEGLARKIASGEVTTALQGKRVLALDVTGLISGTKYRGEFEKRLKKITEEITTANREIILFIDEIHTIVQSQGTEGAINPADIIKPALARGELQTIGATTEQEYRQYIKPELALERRFQPVYIGEPSIEDTVAILMGLKDVYEKHHRVQVSEEAVQAAAELSDKYIHDRFLPDKAIDLIDEGSAKVKLASINETSHLIKESTSAAEEMNKKAPIDITEAPKKLAKLRETLKKMKEEETKIFKQKVLRRHYEKMIQVQQEIAAIESVIREVEPDDSWPIVTAADIEEIVKDWAASADEANDGTDHDFQVMPDAAAPGDAAPGHDGGLLPEEPDETA